MNFGRIASRIFSGAKAQVSAFRVLASSQGHWRSIAGSMAVDQSGRPVPWYTYPAIEYLRSFDFAQCDVFEFGSGNSSLYWSGRARTVISVEDNQTWYDTVRSRMLPNHTLLLRTSAEAYSRAVSEQGREFDLIVIDGKWRHECTVNSLSSLKPDGLIVVDNSDRIIEKECCEFLRSKGFFQIDFSGFGPINGYCWTTSIFVRNGIRLQQGFSGPKPVGGIGN